MKIRPVRAELFHADGRTDNEANSRFFRNFSNAPNKPSHESRNSYIFTVIQ